MLRICPGYRLADGGEPVARQGASSAAPGAERREANFPEAMLSICPGYRPQTAMNP